MGENHHSYPWDITPQSMEIIKNTPQYGVHNVLAGVLVCDTVNKFLCFANVFFKSKIINMKSTTATIRQYMIHFWTKGTLMLYLHSFNFNVFVVKWKKKFK